MLESRVIATSLPLWGLSAGLGVAAACVLYAFFEARLRRRWSSVGDRRKAPSGPYRSSWIRLAPPGRAPTAVRLAALSSLLFGAVFTPSLAFAAGALRAHGVTALLFVAMALALSIAASGVLLLGRAPSAPQIVRLLARICLTLVFILTPLGVAFLLLSGGWGNGAREAALGAVVALLFAVAGAGEAAFLLVVLRGQAAAFERSDGVD